MKKRLYHLAIVSGIVTTLAVAALFVLPHHRAFDPPGLSPRSSGAGPSSEFLNAQRAAEFYRDDIRKHPDKLSNYTALAQLFLQESRITARHHEYIPKAKALLDEALRRSPADFEALVTKAGMLMTLHKFQEARTLITEVLASHEHSAAAFGVLCDACTELGDYPAAIAACDRMLGIRPDLRSYSRASYQREIHGDIPGAVSAMLLAVQAGVPGQENRAWTLSMLANLYLRTGKLDTAEYLYKGILAERPEFPYALSGLAQVDFARGKADSAIQLLTRAGQQTPEHIFFELLADVYRATGRITDAQGIARIVLASYNQHEKDGWNINREYALFCANHDLNLPDALARAAEEYKRRPGNIDVEDTYAWTLYKNGKPSDALPFVERALQINPQNPLFCFHEGMIRHALGDDARAWTMLNRALRESPVLTMRYAGEARIMLSRLSSYAER